MDIKNSSGSIFAASVLALGIFCGLWLHGYENANSRAANTITVTGSTKKIVTADLAKWSATFSRQSDLNNLKQTMDLTSQDAVKIKKLMIDSGLPENSIIFLPFQSSPVYAYYNSAQTLIGYSVSQDVRVESIDIAKIEKLAQDSKKLIDSGTIPQMQRTEYFYTKISELRPELLADAALDAQTRAQAIAKKTGATVGNLKSARTGVIQVLPPNSLDVSDYGAYDLSTKEKEVSATVSVSFELK